MDKPPQNDIKDSLLPKESSNSSTRDLPHICSDHDAGAEEVCATEKVVDEVVPVDGQNTTQSCSSQTSCETTTEECQSVQEVRYSGSHDQLVPDIHRIIPRSSSSENIQQEAQSALDVSLLEDVVIAQELDSQTTLESSDDTDLRDGLLQCYNTSHKKLEIIGCEDMSPVQDSGLDEVLCATLKNVSESVSEVQESCPIIDSVESPSSVDGRERFSEKSDESQESNVESNLLSENTQLVFDRGDQMYASSISVKSVDDVEFGIPKLKDAGTIAVVERFNAIDEPCQTSNLEDTTSCCASDKVCKHSIVKALAASIVDEIVEVAAKRLLESETQIKIAAVGKESPNLENTQEQMSCYEEALQKDVSDNAEGVPESDIKFSEDEDKSLNLNTSSDVPDEIVLSKSNRDNVFESSQLTVDHSNCHLESNTEGLTSVICNGSIVSSSSSPYLDSSPVLDLSDSGSASNVSECGSDVHVDCSLEEDEFNSEVKVHSSNDCVNCENFIECVQATDFTEKEIAVLDLGENSEDASASSYVIDTNLCHDKVKSPIDQESGLEAKVESSTDEHVEGRGKVSPVPNEAGLKENSSCELEDSEGEIASFGEPPVLHATNLDESEDFNLNVEEPCLEEKSLNDLTAASLNNVDDNSGFMFARPECDPQDTNALDYIINFNSVNDEIGCNTELHVEDSPEKKGVEIFTKSISFQENSEKKEAICAEEVNLVRSDSSLVSTCEATVNEQKVAGKEEFSEEEAISDAESVFLSTPNTKKEESTIGKEENSVKEMIPAVESALVLIPEITQKEKLGTEKNKDLVEEVISASESALVSSHKTSEKEEPTIGKEENSKEEVIPEADKTLLFTQEIVEKEEHIFKEEEFCVDDVISSADTSFSDSSHGNVEENIKLICVELKSDEGSLKEDIGASIPLLGTTEDFADEEQISPVLPPGPTEVPLAKQKSVEANNTSNHSGENGHIPPSAMPCQFIVPTVNICPPIIEETYDGITDDESEISHATSDSESDSNVKMIKPSCDGMNTINYRPLLEEDSNERSTLSLISELDEASVKEDNLDSEQLEDEAASLVMDDSVDRIEEDNLNSNSELVQRVRGRRVRHDKIEEVTTKEEKPLKEDTPNTEYAAKIKDIKDALKSDSLELLRGLAKSKGGLVNDEIRKEAWPRLLGIDSSSSSNPLPPINMEDLRKHHEYNQVVLDVNRSLRRFPSKISPEERVKLQDQLTEIILRVLMKRKDLSYYQGYHDVAVTTLLVAGKNAAFHILERISIAHLSDCMLPTMERTMYLLNYIYPLLQRINPNLAERMDRLEIGTIFCLPWFLTWYGYSFNRYENIVRVFDYFLASPPLAPLYLAAVVVGRRSAEVLAADSDHATVHSLLSRIPETLPLEDLLQEATDLYRHYPPDDIEAEVHERCERLRRAQEEEEEERKRVRQRRMIQRRHSMPIIAARQMPGWYILDRFLGLRMIQGRRIIQVSATVMFGMIAWHLKNEVYRYF